MCVHSLHQQNLVPFLSRPLRVSIEYEALTSNPSELTSCRSKKGPPPLLIFQATSGKYNKVQNHRHKPPLRHAFDFWKLIAGKVRNSGIERMARLESDRSVDFLERAVMRLPKALLARSLI